MSCLVVLSKHGAEHPLALGEHERYGHEGEQEEDEPEEGGDKATAEPPLLGRLKAPGQQLRPRYVQREVRFRSAHRLEQTHTIIAVNIIRTAIIINNNNKIFFKWRHSFVILDYVILNVTTVSSVMTAKL